MKINKDTGLTLQNKFVSVEFDQSEKVIKFQDLTDQFNMSAGFSTSKRGLNKAWEYLNKRYGELTTFWQVDVLLEDMGINTHVYSRMD